jgi:hypothetical protein
MYRPKIEFSDLFTLYLYMASFFAISFLFLKQEFLLSLLCVLFILFYTKSIATIISRHIEQKKFFKEQHKYFVHKSDLNENQQQLLLHLMVAEKLNFDAFFEQFSELNSENYLDTISQHAKIEPIFIPLPSTYSELQQFQETRNTLLLKIENKSQLGSRDRLLCNELLFQFENHRFFIAACPSFLWL